jgi:hypothetical protein
MLGSTRAILFERRRRRQEKTVKKLLNGDRFSLNSKHVLILGCRFLFLGFPKTKIHFFLTEMDQFWLVLEPQGERSFVRSNSNFSFFWWSFELHQKFFCNIIKKILFFFVPLLSFNSGNRVETGITSEKVPQPKIMCLTSPSRVDGLVEEPMQAKKALK